MCNCLLRLQLYESKPNKVYSKQRLNGMDYFLKILRSVVCVLLYVKKEYKNMPFYGLCRVSCHRDRAGRAEDTSFPYVHVGSECH